MPDPAPPKSRAAPMMLALVGVFAVPIALAWWLAIVRPPSTSSVLLNYGILIQPPIDVRAQAETRALDLITLEPSEWALMYVGPGGCETTCEAVLNKLALIRSVLGQGATRVRIAALIDDAAAGGSTNVTVADQTARSSISATIKQRIPQAREQAIVFLDWRRQMMMYFDVDAPPGDIKKDIKRLLRASKIK
jgi:hypothetical protein